jgi:2'-5' RNA ligase
MKLAVVAFPYLEDADRRWIESFRAQHDPQASRVAVHFTLVFPVETSADGVASEIATVAAATAAFTFAVGRTEVVTDTLGSGSYVFLVPDEGEPQISVLHDQLYAGMLKTHLRLDIPFTPHMTVGAAADPIAARKLANEIDRQARLVRGIVGALELLEVGATRIRSVATYKLATK